MLDMLEVTHEELQRVLELCYEAQLPLMIWGGPGVGKTYAVQKFAGKHNMAVLTVIVGGEDNLSFGGIPIKDKNGKITLTNRIVAQAQDLINSEIPTVLFLDDFSAGAAQVGSPLFTLIQCRELTGIKLPESWFIVAAGNPPGYEYVAMDLPKPLKSRMAHVVLKPPTAEDWAAWAIESKLDESLIAFVKAYPQALMDDQGIRTPRSWENASRLIQKTNDVGLKKRLIAVTLGTTIAEQWEAFTGQAELDLDAILKNCQLPDELDIAQTHYAIVGLAAKFPSNPEAVVKTLLNAATQNKHCELVVATWALIFKAHYKLASQLIGKDTDAKKLNRAYHALTGELEGMPK